MNKKHYVIGVTGLNNTDNPGPGIPVIRGLRESNQFDCRIVGLVYENLEPGIYMKDLVDKSYQIPYPSSGIEQVISRLEYIQEREHLDVLIPNLDAELFTFMKLEGRLKAMGIHSFMPTIHQFEERHKSNLPDFGDQYGIAVPRSRSILSLQDLHTITEEYSFPFLVKGKFYDAYVAYNEEQASMYFSKLASKWGVPVIIQEFIRGTEVNVIALGDGKGNTIAAVPMRKQFITDKGKAWSGITIADEQMLDITRRLIRATHWRGGMELEMIRTAEGSYYMIEINPRIPAWVYLAVAAGQNIPEALVKLAVGEEVNAFDRYETGKMFIRYSFDLIGDISQFEKLSLSGEF